MDVTKRNAIVFATDRALFPVAAYQARQIASLGLPPETDIVIATESADDIRVALDDGAPFRPLLLDPDWVGSLPMRTDAHLSRATYYRFFLPRLLGDAYRRLLYLDVDIHIHSSRLFAVFNIAMRGHAIGAVRDLLAFRIDTTSKRELRETLTGSHRKYLNAGVLLIDPTAFAEQHLEARLLAAAQTRELRLEDQSAINTVLDGTWLELSQSFNMFAELWESYVPEVCEPVVVHFIGATKPWHGPRFTIPHPAKVHVERHFRSSPWPDFLARFYTFKDAWQQLATPNPRTAISRWPVAFAQDFVEYLRSTQFADVEAGVTTLRLDAIPPIRAIPVPGRPRVRPSVPR